MVNVSEWEILAFSATNQFLGLVHGIEELRFIRRYRKSGTWKLSAIKGSGIDLLQPNTRLRVLQGNLVACEGYVSRIENVDESDRNVVIVRGIDDVGLLADRLTLPSPSQSFNTQTADAYWSESGPAGFIIDRLICRNAGMGAQRPRQVLDSRSGTQVTVNPAKGSAEWEDRSDNNITWAGQVATIKHNEAMRLCMTDAVNLASADFATLVANLTLSGPCNVAVTAYFNDTAVGAHPSEGGVVTELSVIHRAADIGSNVTLWAADMFRRRNPGKGWVRLEIGVQAIDADRTATINAGGGVWTSPLVGSTVKVNTRFKNLAEEVEELATAGGVSLDADTLSGTPKVFVRVGDDKTDEVQLSTLLGNVTRSMTVLGAPEANVVLVAGEGEGTARVTRARVDTDSLNEWGRRIEKFRDARDVDAADTALLDQRGDEVLADSARIAGWQVEALDNLNMQWLIDYNLGDTVTVVTDGAESTDVVAAVEVVLDRDGVHINPILGSSELADNEPGLYAAVRDLRRRLDQLEGRV